MGIGAVLDGLLGSPAYNANVGRTILVGPLNPWNGVEMERLTAPVNRLRLIYGMRGFGAYEHEVILVDAGGISGEILNGYKYYL
ncbi:MAG: hypothetical protein CVU38_18340 [Chloroflexi bacterium HGW-Chloroflexi-1]|nr:MAG: hypothetical protein CVU38_18340 [Chloroflexi bacterium HGW-Chloroflexi-1]